MKRSFMLAAMTFACLACFAGCGEETKELREVPVEGVMYADRNEVFCNAPISITVVGLPEEGVDIVYTDATRTDAGISYASAKITPQEGYKLTMFGTEIPELVLYAKLIVYAKTLTATLEAPLYANGQTLEPRFILEGVVEGDEVPTYTVETEPAIVKEKGSYLATILLDDENYTMTAPVPFEVL